MQNIGQHFARRGEALRDEDAEQVLGGEVRGVERINIGADLFAQNARELLAIGDRVEAREIGLRGRHASGVERGGVGVSHVEVANARFVRAACGVD